MVLEVAQHLGRGVDVDLEQLGIGLAAAGQAADVGERVLTVVLDPGLASSRGCRAATRRRPDTAVVPPSIVGLLDDEHLGAAVVGQGGRGERRASRPDDHHVHDAVPVPGICHAGE